jgi:integrase
MAIMKPIDNTSEKIGDCPELPLTTQARKWVTVPNYLTKAQKAKLKAWRKAHSWHPHQLRHNAATFIRKEFTLETARIILGHHSAAITEVYAERDEQEAIRAITKVG